MIAIVKPNTTKKFQSTATYSSPKLIKSLRKFVLAIQFARMTSALNSMPEWVLDEIGITRAEIRDYARKLIYET